MKHFTSNLLIVCLLLTLFSAPARAGALAAPMAEFVPSMESENIPTFSDKELELHIKQMFSEVVTPRLNSAVKSYIKTYTLKRRDKTAAMIGRFGIYFSMFEKYAREANVPTDLKYLSIVESALNPNAESRSGAVGLWQFMPATGKEQGLKINSEVDERKDPHKSTKAAYKYLKKQYKRYGNWELALAAYNGGAGRVNRAIKRGRSKNFWRIQKYLPKETRNYVPAFIGATYISHYYDLYNITPTPVGAELANTAVTTIKKPYNFRQISEITGTPYYIIAMLNPSYKKSLIPYNHKGNNLVLPQGDMVRFLNYVGRPDHKLEQMIASRVEAPANFNKEEVLLISHDVRPGETIDEIAAQYNHSIDDVRKWNKLKNPDLRPGQRIMLFIQKTPTDFLKYQQIEDLDPLRLEHFQYENYKYSIISGFIPQIEDPGKYAHIKPHNQKDFVFYRLKRRETLMDVLQKFPEVTMEELMELNDLDRYSKVKPGKKLKIKEK
ncbi:MAG: membrane-bound lytic murein transglycosylase D [Polaribacter sp.]|jgi:membrane-bound lytic murein transglycosylase D